MSRRRIEGWKEIKAYLATTRTTRTLYNWRKTRALPVRQLGRTVFAWSNELDAWTEQQDRLGQPHSAERSPPVQIQGAQPVDSPHAAPSAQGRSWRLLLSLAALTAALAIGAILIAWLLPSDPQLAEVILEERTFRALDRKGRTLWSKTFPSMASDHNLEESRLPSHMTLDLNDDGELELLLNYVPRESKKEKGWLGCFNSDGNLRWKFEYGQGLTLRDRDLEPFFAHSFFYYLELADRPLILTVARHSTWYPAQVALLEPATGALIDQYWHPGFFYSHLLHDFDRDGDVELLLGGVNNPGFGLGRPALVLIDLPFHTNTLESAKQNFFAPANSKEVAYFLFPQPDSFTARRIGAGICGLSALPDSKLQIALGQPPDNLLYYYLSDSFEIDDLRPSDMYISHHDRLAKEGFLDHSFSIAELANLTRIERFPTAPDANSRQVQALFDRDQGP